MLEKAIEYLLILMTALVLIWMVASWVDVVNHNDPSGGDGDPSRWNAFVVMTEAAK